MVVPLRPAWLLTGWFALAACAAHAQQAVALYETGDYAGAARAAETGLVAHPDDEGLWQMRIRAALAQGDAPGVGKAYATYRTELGGDDDRPLLRDLAIATLGQALASPSAKLKIAAIDAVATAELQALADQVAQRMTDDDDRVVAAAAIAILRAYPQAPKVAGDMLHSEDAEARRIAVDGIGRKVGKLALADLETAGGDPDARVRRTAIRWLGQLGDGRAIELLIRGTRDPDDTVRAAAASAVAKLGAGFADVGQLASQALADPSIAVRLAGIELLISAHAADQRAQLVALAGDPDPFIATEAAIAAGGGELAVRALDRAAGSREWAIRAGAVNIAMRAVDRPAAIALAHKLAADPDPGVRIAAGRLLAHAGEQPAAATIFATALTSPAHALQAGTELAAQNDARGIYVLEAAVRDPEHGPAARAAAAAAHRSARRITPSLVAALADDSGTVRVEAATAIAVLVKHE